MINYPTDIFSAVEICLIHFVGLNLAIRGVATHMCVKRGGGGVYLSKFKDARREGQNGPTKIEPILKECQKGIKQTKNIQRWDFCFATMCCKSCLCNIEYTTKQIMINYNS